MSYRKFGIETEFDEFEPRELKTKAIVFDENDIGKLTMCGSETRRHFMAKSIVLFELRKLKHRCVCEAEICGIGRLDVYDMDSNCIYELESDQYPNRSRKAKKKYQQAGVDIVIIPIPKTDSITEFVDHIKAFIRPD